MKLRALTSLCLLGLMVGCGGDVPLPPAAPLATPMATIEALPGAVPGIYDVVVAQNLTLAEDNDHRAIALNLYYPAQGQNFPLLIFSHGNWSNKDSYDNIIKHWVSHGYAVIAPDHLDCCSMAQGIFNSLRYGQLALITERVDDINRLLDNLDGLEQLHPAFADKADVSRLGITGHSFGAFSAQQFGGAGTFDPDTEEFLYFPDPAVKAIVAISPPGPMFDTITAGSWQRLSTPNLVATGTWDIQPSFWPDWRMHLMSYDSAPASDKYALVTQGADHFLGGLICRLELEETPQDDALTMLRVASTNFLNAYLKGDTAALAFINSATLTEVTAGFSVLTSQGEQPY
ncbi:MAG: alpha/beta fold hydrolase [Halioglobus sp.]